MSSAVEEGVNKEMDVAKGRGGYGTREVEEAKEDKAAEQDVI